MVVYKSCAFLILLVFLGVIFHEEQAKAIAKNSLRRKNSYVSDISKDVLKQLSQTSQKLNELEKKIDSLSSKETGPCAGGRNTFLY